MNTVTTIAALAAGFALVACKSSKDDAPKHVDETPPQPPPVVDPKPEAKVAALTGVSVTAPEGSPRDAVRIAVAAVDKDGKPAPGDHQIHVEFMQGDIDLCDLWIEFDSQNPFTTNPSLPAEKKNCVRPQGGAPVQAKLTETASKVSATVEVGPGSAIGSLRSPRLTRRPTAGASTPSRGHRWHLMRWRRRSTPTSRRSRKWLRSSTPRRLPRRR